MWVPIKQKKKTKKTVQKKMKTFPLCSSFACNRCFSYGWKAGRWRQSNIMSSIALSVCSKCSCDVYHKYVLSFAVLPFLCMRVCTKNYIHRIRWLYNRTRQFYDGTLCLFLFVIFFFIFTLFGVVFLFLGFTLYQSNGNWITEFYFFGKYYTVL